MKTNSKIIKIADAMQEFAESCARTSHYSGQENIAEFKVQYGSHIDSTDLLLAVIELRKRNSELADIMTKG